MFVRTNDGVVVDMTSFKSSNVLNELNDVNQDMSIININISSDILNMIMVLLKDIKIKTFESLDFDTFNNLLKAVHFLDIPELEDPMIIFYRKQLEILRQQYDCDDLSQHNGSFFKDIETLNKLGLDKLD